MAIVFKIKEIHYHIGVPSLKSQLLKDSASNSVNMTHNVQHMNLVDKILSAVTSMELSLEINQMEWITIAKSNQPNHQRSDLKVIEYVYNN